MLRRGPPSHPQAVVYDKAVWSPELGDGTTCTFHFRVEYDGDTHAPLEIRIPLVLPPIGGEYTRTDADKDVKAAAHTVGGVLALYVWMAFVTPVVRLAAAPVSAAEARMWEEQYKLIAVGAAVQARPRLESAPDSKFDCEKDNSAFNLNPGL